MEHIIKKETFVEEFINNFVPLISVKELKKLNCYAPNYGYLWMVCEHNLVENLKGIEAKIAYDKVDKTGAIEFQYDNGFLGDDVSIPLSKENDTSEKINKSGLIEFYVIGKDFSWCYIVTHEPDGCGPYFIIKEKIKIASYFKAVFSLVGYRNCLCGNFLILPKKFLILPLGV